MRRQGPDRLCLPVLFRNRTECTDLSDLRRFRQGDQGKMYILLRNRIYIQQEEDPGVNPGRNRQRTERPHPREGRAGLKRRAERRPAGGSECIQTSHLPAPGDAYLLHGSNLFCTGGAWRGHPGRNGRRRSHLYGKTGDQDRYQGALKGQGSTVPAGFQSKRGSLCDPGDPDSGQTERRGEGSAA